MKYEDDEIDILKAKAALLIDPTKRSSLEVETYTIVPDPLASTDIVLKSDILEVVPSSAQIDHADQISTADDETDNTSQHAPSGETEDESGYMVPNVHGENSSSFPFEYIPDSSFLEETDEDTVLRGEHGLSMASSENCTGSTKNHRVKKRSYISNMFSSSDGNRNSCGLTVENESSKLVSPSSSDSMRTGDVIPVLVSDEIDTEYMIPDSHAERNSIASPVPDKSVNSLMKSGYTGKNTSEKDPSYGEIEHTYLGFNDVLIETNLEGEYPSDVDIIKHAKLKSETGDPMSKLLTHQQQHENDIKFADSVKASEAYNTNGDSRSFDHTYFTAEDLQIERHIDDITSSVYRMASDTSDLTYNTSGDAESFGHIYFSAADLPIRDEPPTNSALDANTQMISSLSSNNKSKELSAAAATVSCQNETSKSNLDESGYLILEETKF